MPRVVGIFTVTCMRIAGLSAPVCMFGFEPRQVALHKVAVPCGRVAFPGVQFAGPAAAVKVHEFPLLGMGENSNMFSL